jgi:signal transduction histidine kinase
MMHLFGNPVLLQVQAPPRSPPSFMGNSTIAIGLLLGAMVLGGIGLVAMALWRRREMGGGAPAKSLELARMEMETLARLAIASNQQAEALQKERDARQQVEADSHVTQELLARSRDEKVRLGRDLHDGIIQSLYAAGLTLESARPLIATKPGEADLRIAQSVQALNAAIRELRGFIAGLSPESLRATEFSRALDAALAGLSSGREVRIDVQIDDDAAALLAENQSTEVLQVAREAVSNALRHGGASAVTLRMHKGDHAFCLLIQDNGAGFTAPSAPADGHGLRNMQARADRMGGTLAVSSKPGDGTRVLLTVPASAPA